jgi:hypothetical protein
MPIQKTRENCDDARVGLKKKAHLLGEKFRNHGL